MRSSRGCLLYAPIQVSTFRCQRDRASAASQEHRSARLARSAAAASGTGEDAPDEDPQVPHGWAAAGTVEHPLELGPFQQGPSQPDDCLPWAAWLVWLPASGAHGGGEVAVAGDDVTAVLAVRQGGRGKDGGIQQLLGRQAGG